jgi:hypothetical protein
MIFARTLNKEAGSLLLPLILYHNLLCSFLWQSVMREWSGNVSMLRQTMTWLPHSPNILPGIPFCNTNYPKPRMKRLALTARQKALVLVPCLALTVVGFMLKLPSSFRSVDKELHALFYFLAAAVLNVLFAGTSLLRHIILFISLFVFGMAIEYAQEYSNRFFRKRIHGRFDPEDIQWNLKGLIAFSAVWFLFTAAVLLYRKSVSKNNAYGPKA